MKGDDDMTVISIGAKGPKEEAIAKAAAEEGWMSMKDAGAFLATTRTNLYVLMGDDKIVWRKQGKHRVLLRKSVREYAEKIARGLT